uniref:Uncharacterized protein n=1 Tax=Oryza punctata TaxID=4537 RepID=A0A0E0KXR2_ORYPU
MGIGRGGGDGGGGGGRPAHVGEDAGPRAGEATVSGLELEGVRGGQPMRRTWRTPMELLLLFSVKLHIFPHMVTEPKEINNWATAVGASSIQNMLPAKKGLP